ncbi:hypothetical protein Q75_01925, partial [Bacillus coahuilensis p1.1.43]
APGASALKVGAFSLHVSALIPELGASLFLVGYPIALLLAPGASALKVGAFPLHLGALFP